MAAGIWLWVGAALDEGRALGVHLRLDLLAHRAPQQVRAAERVAGEDLRGLHDLFLVDEDPVGFLQDAFEQRVGGYSMLSWPFDFVLDGSHFAIVGRCRSCADAP